MDPAPTAAPLSSGRAGRSREAGIRRAARAVDARPSAPMGRRAVGQDRGAVRRRARSRSLAAASRRRESPERALDGADVPGVAAVMRAVLLCTDAYGGHGGIALYNRDLAEALAARPDCEEVIVVPRVMRREPHEIPARVTFIAEAARGPVHYMRAIARARRARPDLVICGHVNLLPVAFAIARRPILMIYGIE